MNKALALGLAGVGLLAIGAAVARHNEVTEQVTKETEHDVVEAKQLISEMGELDGSVEFFNNATQQVIQQHHQLLNDMFHHHF